MIEIKLFILTWFIVHFEPLNNILNYLYGLKFKKPISLLIKFILKITNCMMCCSFWMSLLFTQDIYIASLMAFIGFWYERIENRLDIIKLN